MNKTYKVGIVGSGVMGSGLAQILSTSEAVDSVVWCSGRGNDLTRRYEELLKVIERQVKKGRLAANAYEMALNKLTIVNSLDGFEECDFIHEAVFENVAIKYELLERLDACDHNNSIIATNTSSISITDLARKMKHPQQFVGMHFFNPVTLMKLVEIVKGYNTDLDVVEKAKSYVLALEKYPIVVSDSPGFIVNRMIIPMINEAVCILAENVADRDSIDSALKLGANHPIGPLALSDLIGNDVVLSIMEVLYTETGDQKYRPHSYLKKIVRAGMLGKKTGKGFYDY